MTAAHAATEPGIDLVDDVFDEADKFECRGDWTEERKEILKNVTGEEIDAEIMRLQAAHPERYLTPEQIMAMAERVEEPETVGA
jgi:L-ribulose-5-phosphate 3-epimerase UlaE